MLIRTWNVFHGNVLPLEREGHLEEAVHLAIAGDPDVLCLQEVPVWALERLGDWSGMAVFGEVAAPPRLGPLPSNAEVGRLLTRLNHGFFRSALSGQANAILLSRRFTPLGEHAVELNSKRFREVQARVLELDLVTRLAWAKERRVCQAVRATAAGQTFVFANLHATGLPDDRLPDAELLRAASFADGLAKPGEVCVLAGDFNVRPERSRTLAEITKPEWGFSAPGPALDQVLVRGARAKPPVVWRLERRLLGKRLLSDHAPVDLEIA